VFVNKTLILNFRPVVHFVYFNLKYTTDILRLIFISFNIHFRSDGLF